VASASPTPSCGPNPAPSCCCTTSTSTRSRTFPRPRPDRPRLIHAPEQFVWRRTLLADLRGVRETASWVLVNTFDALEHATIEALGAHLPKKIVPVGPLFDPEIDGGQDDECAAWLDAQPPRSVVFVAFGSILKLNRDEVAELAAGLADTGRPFLWVVSDDNRDLLPDGDDCLAPVTAGGDGTGKVVAWCEQGACSPTAPRGAS
jgi:gallate 1-beta-glucosyltransferase